jgi:hypothetical protein
MSRHPVPVRKCGLWSACLGKFNKIATNIDLNFLKNGFKSFNSNFVIGLDFVNYCQNFLSCVLNFEELRHDVRAGKLSSLR